MDVSYDLMILNIMGPYTNTTILYVDLILEYVSFRCQTIDTKHVTRKIELSHFVNYIIIILRMALKLFNVCLSILKKHKYL